jgi:hypothetical protein
MEKKIELTAEEMELVIGGAEGKLAGYVPCPKCKKPIPAKDLAIHLSVCPKKNQ